MSVTFARIQSLEPSPLLPEYTIARALAFIIENSCLLWFVKIYSFIHLKVRLAEKEKTFYLLVTPPDALSHQGWARSKTEARNLK